MSRHQALKSDTCDFLMSLVKNGKKSPINTIPYKGSFTNAIKPFR